MPTYRRQMRRASGSEIVVHALAIVGVAFWVVMVVRAMMGVGDHTGPKLYVAALLLGGAHLLISVSTRRRTPLALSLTWLVTGADVILALAVNPKAWVLVGASIVMIVAGNACRRSWATEPVTVNA